MILGVVLFIAVDFLFWRDCVSIHYVGFAEGQNPAIGRCSSLLFFQEWLYDGQERLGHKMTTIFRKIYYHTFGSGPLWRMTSK